MSYTWLKILWAFLNLLAFPSLFLWASQAELSIRITLVLATALFIFSNLCLVAILYLQYKKRNQPAVEED
ncbi:hypothetical protein H7198_03550 [Fructobacillus sp. CRL 2054]|uniref:hypothetical protein n=1 Tax=Fructobacillus sp. CRL 2054 TaxID=2763007 RepID=UPI002378587C|nr:hypothetical protein [Fructobacillus sp. CRL 2054]MDD9138676.1 hypothetical protein [Fructobacillus sp. CRL 2054]